MLISFIRTSILYVVIIFSLRVMGRRQVGELQPSELVITMLISNLAAHPIEDKGLPVIAGIVPILTLVSYEIFTSYLLKDSVFWRKTICGSPQVIIINGKINQKNMKKLRFSIEDLLETLRINGIFDFSEVDCAIAETNGQLSVYKKFQYQEVENIDLGIENSPSNSLPFVIINDGVINSENLNYCKKDTAFIKKTLKKEKTELKKVLVMICDKNGKYTIVEKE